MGWPSRSRRHWQTGPSEVNTEPGQAEPEGSGLEEAGPGEIGREPRWAAGTAGVVELGLVVTLPERHLQTGVDK